MKELEKSNMMCGKCNMFLEDGKIDLTYQKQFIPVKLLRCPKCGQVYISEELVKGKMFEVEKALEDK
ncbi:hypothetical protein Psch_04165 [Pelotomaculum schinkii]|uniref:DUF7479 domain-containing protein n=1 Tax=Pelotomaculum schinkii TaxID=78350 RepID=A0A4Y7R637_9FIRM|nr:CLJU_RS11820 family redox protein [Pelotomaculum schinkii]TEB04438.1 hypothetical protein Psch_04165 [Pelotomaculum schinkii]